MKKLIALLIITGFFVVTIAGCPGTTSSSGPKTTGGGMSTGTGSK